MTDEDEGTMHLNQEPFDIYIRVVRGLNLDISHT